MPLGRQGNGSTSSSQSRELRCTSRFRLQRYSTVYVWEEMTKYPNPTRSVHSGSQMSETAPRFVGDLSTEQFISKLAQDETGKRQHYRPIYSLHKWWARRPGTLFRSIILLATRPELRESLFQTDAAGNLSSKSAYFSMHSLNDLIILDPFMGGGTTLVEANRLGAKVIGCDLNPVAYWVVRETLKPIDLEKLRNYFLVLERTAGERIKSLYRTRCVHCGNSADTLYVFWIRAIPCALCNHAVPLYKRTLLNEGHSRNRPLSPLNPATVFCPDCKSIFLWGGEGEAHCPECKHHFAPYEGTYDQGKYRCPSCETPQNLLDTLRDGARLSDRPVAIEYWCSCCQARLYKALDIEDRDLLRKVEDEYESKKAHLVIPHQAIPMGSSSRRWIQHGYTHYRDVFNARQILALNYLIEAIREIEEEEYRNAFYTILSNMLEYNNMMTPYNYPNRKLHHLFNYHALPLTTTPVENAVWGASEEGAGTFVNCYKRYENAKRYAQMPYERYKDASGQVVTIPMKQEHISAAFVRSFHELSETSRGALLFCRDSSRLPEIPDKSVDFVITDPPYYDSIHYSELSNFFYVWLSRLASCPHFTTELVPTEQEAIVNKGMDKGEEQYLELLRSVFRECHRVLKDEGKLIFTFHHTKPEAWWVVFKAVIGSGFHIADYFAVQSEYRVNPHIRNKQALDMDLVIVCQKMLQPHASVPESPADALNRATELVGKHGGYSQRNLVFLHFVGELLRSASCLAEHSEVSYSWFESALKAFDTLYKERTDPNGACTANTAAQLALFESKTEYNGANHGQESKSD